MRKLLTTEGTHQLKANVTRLYIKRPTGGNGLVELESVYDAALVGLASIQTKAKRGLTDYCKNMIPGKTNTLTNGS